MSVVTLTIDGQLISGRSGDSILTVAREHGIPIPTLCHLDGLSERGGCRLCLVEVSGSSQLVPACTTSAQEGQEIATATERLIAYRRMILELLLAEGVHVCAVCVVNGDCDLQALAAHHGVDHVRYDYLPRTHEVDATHDRFVLDRSRCVLCTRCVRTCDEVEGAHTWDVAGRGASARIVADLNVAWGTSRTCTSCGKCVQVCPTGALTRRGSTAAEMTKDRGFLTWILDGREKNIWSRT